MNRRRVAMTTLACALLLAACGSSSSGRSAGTRPESTTTSVPAGTTPTTAMPASTPTITIRDFDFGAPITVAKGTRVTVKNTDPTTHSLSSDDASFDARSIPSMKTATFVAPMKPGTYKFHCNFHANMHGSIVVTP